MAPLIEPCELTGLPGESGETLAELGPIVNKELPAIHVNGISTKRGVANGKEVLGVGKGGRVLGSITISQTIRLLCSDTAKQVPTMWALKTVQKMPKCVRVEWEDGAMANFNYLWLRDNSARRPSLVHLDLELKPETVDCSPDALNLVWPPFLATDYSTNFLRANAATSFVDIGSISEARVKSLRRALKNPCDQSGRRMPNWLITPRSAELDPKLVTGQLFWQSAAQEPGTVWPWMRNIPSLCAIESTNDLPEVKLTLVDQHRAYQLMSERHPEEFAFLTRCELEYSSEGLFHARHAICARAPNGDIIPGVFNNVARSAAITVEPIADFYTCLQKLGRVFADATETVELHPDERLLVNNATTLLGAPAQRDRELMLRCLSF